MGLPYSLRSRLNLALVPASCLILLLKTIDATGGVDQLLPAREERVARRADFHADIALVRSAGFERIAAGANDVRLIIDRVNSSFHGKRRIPFEI